MWFVYVVRCADDTLYCGIARDVAARMAQHDAGKGAKYTRGRGPLTLLLQRRCREKGTALRLEHAIKQLTRAEKQRLVVEPTRIVSIVHRLARLGRLGRLSRATSGTPARGASGARGSRSARPRRRGGRSGGSG